MKNFILLLLGITIIQHASAQQIMPFHQSTAASTPDIDILMQDKGIKKTELSNKQKERTDLQNIKSNTVKAIQERLDFYRRTLTDSSSIMTRRRADSLRNAVTVIERKKDSIESNTSAQVMQKDKEIETLEKDIDSLNKVTERKKLLASIKKMNESPNFSVSGVGGVSGIEKLSNTGGNLAISVVYRVGKYKPVGNGKWVDPVHVYLGFNTRTASSDDTGKISKSFLFPDISKRDFVAGAYFNFVHAFNGWNIDPTVEFSLNRYKVVKDDSATQSSISQSFTSESALLGVKFSYRKEFAIAGDTIYETGFYLFPYYNIINVQPKNFADYHTVLNTNDIPATVHAIGLQAGFLLSKVQMFANVKYFMNKERDAYPADFKGMTYTIGTVIAVDVLRFRL